MRAWRRSYSRRLAAGNRPFAGQALPHHRRHEVLERGRAHLLHLGAGLVAQQLKRALDTRLAEGAESPEIGPADADCRCAHAQRLDDVGAAAEAGVDQHRHVAGDRDDLRQRLDGGRPAVLGAPAMVRHDDGVDAVLAGQLRVLPGDDALDHHLHLGDVADPLDVVPAHGGRQHVCHPGEIETLESRPSLEVGGDARTIVALVALPGVEACHAGLGLGEPCGTAIDRHRHSDTARPLGAPHMVGRDLEIVGGIELKPDRGAARLGHVLDRGRALVGQQHQVVSELCRVGDRGLPVGVKGLVTAGRTEHDRGWIFVPEQFKAGVRLADVDQAPRAQDEFLEALAIGAQGLLLVGTSRHKAEMRRRHVLGHHRLEVEDAERLLRARDQLVEAARRPDHRVGQAVGRFVGEGGEIGTPPSSGLAARNCRNLRRLAAWTSIGMADLPWIAPPRLW